MEELLRYWQKVLRLEDWTIALETECEPHKLEIENTDGTVEYTEANKTAIIRILAEKCYGKQIRPYDPTRILIHELLHLKFSLISDCGNDIQDRIIHQIIDDLAKGFSEIESRS